MKTNTKKHEIIFIYYDDIIDSEGFVIDRVLREDIIYFMGINKEDAIKNFYLKYNGKIISIKEIKGDKQ